MKKLLGFVSGCINLLVLMVLIGSIVCWEVTFPSGLIFPILVACAVARYAARVLFRVALSLS